MEIEDLTNNPGLMTLRTNEARIIEEHHKLVHVINLLNFENSIKNIRDNINYISNGKCQHMIVETLRHKLIILENSFEVIKPHFRTKRGLINILGSGIKFITGNMDNEDAIEIKNSIEEITLNNKQLIKSHNDQIIINREMIDRFENITDHINDQQEIIKNHIFKFEDKMKNDVRYLQFLYQINFDVDIIKSHLDDIFQTIQMAKLNIISKTILAPREISFIYDKLSEQNVRMESLEQVYEMCKLQAFYNGSNILFVIKFPKLKNTEFNEYLLESLPNNKNKRL